MTPTFFVAYAATDRSIKAQWQSANAAAARAPSLGWEHSLWYLQPGAGVIRESSNWIWLVSGTYDRGVPGSGLAVTNQPKGPPLLSELQGPFISITLEKSTRRLTVSRDPMGLQTVYYLYHDDTLFIADCWSSLASLLPDRAAKFNWIKALAYSDRSLHDYEAVVQGVFELPEGASLVAEPRQTSIHSKVVRFWSIPGPNAAVHSAVDCPHLFRDALMKAAIESSGENAPANILLSGGVDSTALAELLTPAMPLSGYSIVNPLTYLLNDTTRAMQVANILRMQCRYYLFSYETMRPDPAVWEAMIRITESPAVDVGSAIKFSLYNEISRTSGSPVVLTGFGADQICGGTARTSLNAKGVGFDENNHWPAYEQLMERSRVESALGAGSSPVAEYSAFLNVSALESRYGLRSYDNAWIFGLERQRTNFTRSTIRPEERLTAHFGLKLRCPFLDPRVVTIMATLPPSVYAELLFDKVLVRQLLGKTRELFAAQVQTRRKTAIWVPEENNPTHLFYFHLLYDRPNGLIWRILPEVESLSSVFNAPRLANELRQLEHKSDPSFTAWVMPIVNAVLLYQFVQSLDSRRKVLPPHAVEITAHDIETRSRELTRMLGLDAPSNEFQGCIRFAPDIRVLDDPARATLLLARDGRILFELERRPTPAFVLVCALADGAECDVAALADRENLDRELLYAFIDDGLKAAMLELIRPGAN